MEITNKCNRTSLFAAAVVAVLALAAFTGVVMYSDNAQAADGEITYAAHLKGDITIGAQYADANIFMYVDGGTTSVTVPAGLQYSGTLSFGYYDELTGIGLAFGSVTLDKVTEATVKYDGTSMSIVDNSVTGNKITATLLKGKITMTDSTATYKAGDATIEAAGVSGMTVGIEGSKAYVAGAPVTGSVKIAAGTVKAYDGFRFNGENFSVANGATLRVGATPSPSDYTPVISYSNASTVTATINGAAATIDAAKKTITPSAALAPRLEGYDVEITADVNTVVKGKLVINYDGEMVLDIANPMLTLNASGTAVMTAATAGVAVHYAADLGTAMSKNTTVTPAYVAGDPGTSGAVISDGKVTFNVYEPLGIPATPTVFTVFAGEVVEGKYATSVTVTPAAGDTTLSKDGKFTTTAIPTFTLQPNPKVTPGTPVASSIDFSAGTISVEGTIDATRDSYMDASNTERFLYSTVTNTGGVITVDGKGTADGKVIIDQIAGAPDPITERINGTLYSKPNKTPADYYTFTYTILADALANAKEVTVYGKNTVEADLTVEGKGATDSDPTKVTFINGSRLNIGSEDGSAIVSVPDATDISTLKTTSAVVEVVNGKFILNGNDAAPVDPYAADKVIAAVYVYDSKGTGDSKDDTGTYTDLATALNEAKSPDVIQLRTGCMLSKDAEIKEGVTLDTTAGNFPVVVGVTTDDPGNPYSDVKLTVSGKVEGGGIIAVPEGSTVVLNSDVGTVTNTYAAVGGTIQVAEGKNVNAGALTMIWGTFDVDGTVTYKVAPGAYSNSIIVPMAVPITFTAPAKAKIVVDVAGAIDTTVASTMDYDNVELTVSGEIDSADDTGLLTVDDANAVVTVTGKAHFAALTAKTLEVVSKAPAGTAAAITVDAPAVEIDGALTVDKATVSGTLNAGSAAIRTLTLTGGTFKVGDDSAVDSAYVTGAATVAAADGKKITVLNEMIVGQPAKIEMKEVTNDAKVSGVELGVNAIANVYGNAAGVTIGPAGVKATQIYMVDMADNSTTYAYVKEFVNGVKDSPTLATAPVVEGYTFFGWFTAASQFSGQPATKGIGDYPQLFGLFQVKTFKVTFEINDANGNHLKNAFFSVNGGKINSGDVVTYKYGEVLKTIILVSNTGFDLKGAPSISIITASGSSGIPSGGFVVKSDATVKATFGEGSGVVESKDDDNGLTLTEILLIVLIIIAAIVMIAVVSRLARS